MSYLYFVLLGLSLILFGIGFYFSKLQKKSMISSKDNHFSSSNIELLENEVTSEPIILKSTLLEESLEVFDDEEI